MINSRNKALLENKIYSYIKNILQENDQASSEKRTEVMKWLSSAEQKHSVLSKKLWPDRDKDAARSLFSKKYRGHDADGKAYSFTDEEITLLFNMKDRYVDKIG